MKGITGLRLIVTGASGGIGQALVRRLAEEGARPAALDVVALPQPGLVFARQVDVVDEIALGQAVDEARRALGGIDGLVALAGIQATSPTHEIPLATFRHVVDVSLVGTFLSVKAVLPAMLEQGAGRIVTIGSTAAVCAAPDLAAYAAAKGGVLAFTRAIAVEYGRRGIRANCLCPGGTRTPLLDAIDQSRLGEDHFRSGHPIGRYATPEEIASTCCFLLSDDASFVLGATVMADGGYSCA